MLILQIIIFFIFIFAGYVVGRWGDNYLNFWMKDPKWAPDHWIYGFLLIFAALFFKDGLKLGIFSFGMGLFISDLKDFLNLKFFGSDNKKKEDVKFWHID